MFFPISGLGNFLHVVLQLVPVLQQNMFAKMGNTSDTSSITEDT